MEQMINKKQDLTYLSWSKIRNSSGTAGSFLKSYSDLGDKKVYYKLSNYDAYKGMIGHESVNEIIADRLLNTLGVAHLHYQLIYADIMIDNQLYTTYLCASEDFKQPGESKIALDAYYQAERNDGESPLAFCIRMGWAQDIYTMLAVDFLILNRDRHGANMEVLRNSRKKTLRLAPLFDHGLSLLFPCMTEEDVLAADVLEDKRVQCFVGSQSAWENLNLIPSDQLPHLKPLTEADQEVLFSGLDSALPDVWQQRIWEMIWRRWLAYEDFCHSR